MMSPISIVATAGIAVWALFIPSALAADLIEPPTDYTGVSLVVTAAGVFLATVIGAVFTGVLSLRAARRSEAAERKSDVAAAAAVEAKDQSIQTAKAVDGKLTEVVKLVAEKATAEATLAEKDAQTTRELAAAAKAPTLAGGVIAIANGDHPDKADAILVAARQLVKALEEAKR